MCVCVRVCVCVCVCVCAVVCVRTFGMPSRVIVGGDDPQEPNDLFRPGTLVVLFWVERVGIKPGGFFQGDRGMNM